MNLYVPNFMKNNNKTLVLIYISAIWFGLNSSVYAQKTKIRGFADVSGFYQDDKLSFGIGEFDLFFTSELSDRISFLGEVVFKYSPNSSSHFTVGVERVIIDYNYSGNHSLLFGKHHTPINYWNDTYHHGRVFFPTIRRPILFYEGIIPIHTTGVAAQGLNLGNLRFGYNLMIGNGLGSGELVDNDKYKSVTATAHIKPWENFQVRASFYSDVISEGAEIHGEIIEEKVNQQMFTGSIIYFGNRFEFLAESSFINNKTESLGSVNSLASYVYGGVIINEKWIPYFRYDNLTFENEEPYFHNEDINSMILGLRYEINYLIVVKLEYEYIKRDFSGTDNIVTAQFAIGF